MYIYILYILDFSAFCVKCQNFIKYNDIYIWLVGRNFS